MVAIRGGCLAQTPEEPSEPIEEAAPSEGTQPTPPPTEEPQPGLFGTEPLPDAPKTRPWAVPGSQPIPSRLEQPAEIVPEPALPPQIYLPFQRDPLALTAINQAQTNAETFYDGLGGIPNPLESVFLGTTTQERKGFLLGPLSFEPTLSAGFNYRKSQGTDSTSEDPYGFLGASFALGIGDPRSGTSFGLNYGATFRVPFPDDEESPLDQALSLRATLRFVKLELGLGIDFSALSGPNRDFGSTVQRDFLTVALTSSYQFAPKSSFEWDIVLPVRQFSEGVSSAGITSTNFLNYQYRPKTALGIGISVGVLEVQKGSTQTFEQLLLRLHHDATGKLRFNGTAGVEFRDSGEVKQTTPIFGLGVDWRWRPGTQFTLSADRRVVNSAADVDNNYTSTSVTASANQRLGNRFSFATSLGYEYAEYTSLDRDQSFSRTDHVLLAQLGLTFQSIKHWNASLVFSGGKNFSSVDSSQFLQLSLVTSFVF